MADTATTPKQYLPLFFKNGREVKSSYINAGNLLDDGFILKGRQYIILHSNVHSILFNVTQCKFYFIKKFCLTSYFIGYDSDIDHCRTTIWPAGSLNNQLHTNRIQRLFFPHLFVDLFCKNFSQPVRRNCTVTAIYSNKLTFEFFEITLIYITMPA